MTLPGAAPFWEPLVQGRVYELDHSANYLAVPGSFGPDDLAWARRFVNGSRRSAVEAVLWRIARLCLFKDRRHCGVGVALPAGLICDDRDKTMDHHRNRENYVFLGGVAPCDQALFPGPPHHPGIPELGALRCHLREFLGPLYEDFVVARYHEKPLPGSGGELLAIRSEPRVLFPPHLPVVTSAPPTLALRGGAPVTAWPSTFEGELWAAACLAEPPVSLCLNVTKEADARASGFDHVTIWGERGRVEKNLTRQEAPRSRSALPARPSPVAEPDRPEKTYEFELFGWEVTVRPLPESRQNRQPPEGQPRGKDLGRR